MARHGVDGREPLAQVGDKRGQRSLLVLGEIVLKCVSRRAALAAKQRDADAVCVAPFDVCARAAIRMNR